LPGRAFVIAAAILLCERQGLPHRPVRPGLPKIQMPLSQEQRSPRCWSHLLYGAPCTPPSAHGAHRAPYGTSTIRIRIICYWLERWSRP